MALGANDVRALMERHGLRPSKALGQNFVVDPGVVRRIVALAGVGRGDAVVEVGPGLGSLTLALCDAGAEVVAVERDADLVPVLHEVLVAAGHPGVRVVTADATTVDWPALLDDRRWVMVSNLPYNVAVPVVIGMLRGAPMVQRLVVMVQREVADRLVARPGGRTIGVPSVKVAWYGEARTVASVPPEVFLPRPRVMSSVVVVDRRPPPSEVVGPEDVFALVETAYRQRRKMLRSTLGSVVPAPAFTAAGVAPTARPEELGVEDWARLAEAVAARPAPDPGATEAPPADPTLPP